MANEISIGIAPVYSQQIAEDGPYTAEHFVLDAQLSAGEVYHHEHVFDRVEDALEFLDRVVAHKAHNATWSPVDNEHWTFVRRSYGSESWQANASEEEHRMARVEVEAEYGPGSYGPDHPGYLRR